MNIMENFNLEELKYIKHFNSIHKKQNARYEKLAERKQKYNILPKWYLCIKK